MVHELDTMLKPGSIAVVGAARERPGVNWVDIFGRIVEFGYEGRLYPVNPRADEIRGHQAYPSVSSLPETADLVIIALAAPHVPEVLRECADTGHRNVHIFSAGFGEIGEEEGDELQHSIEHIAAEGALRVIGPNSMGLYVPDLRLVTWTGASALPGPVAVVGQSGGFVDAAVGYGSRLGLSFSTVVNYGSGLTVDATSLIDYLATDDRTGIITAYLEGVNDGQRLLDVVRQAVPKKPVVIVKPGRTEAAARTVASHTGSLAGNERIWEAFFAQSGAIRATSVPDLMNTTLALLKLPRPGGPRVAVIGTGGGSSVAAADAFSQAGLEVPAFGAETLKRLRAVIPASGNIITNPIDAHDVMTDVSLMPGVLDVLGEADNVDMVIVYFHIDWMSDVGPDRVPALADFLANAASSHVAGKPLVVTWRSYRPDPEMARIAREMESTLLAAGIPVFPDLEHTARALANLVKYHSFLEDPP